MKQLTTAVTSTGPIMLDLLGVHVPALSMLLGLTAVITVRIMFLSKEFKNTASFWFYNIALTLLMGILTLVVIADRQLGPGLSVMLGIGVGASGVVIVDILKDRVQNIIKAAVGKME